jgi:hypothetical protein
MASAQLEQRVAALEAEAAKLKSKLEERETSTPWWEPIVGTFQDDLIYEQAMRLGSHTAKKLANHIGAMKLFICHYNLTRAAA